MIREDFAGAGGCSEGKRLAGIQGPVIGVEIEKHSIATAEAAGHARLCADVREVRDRDWGQLEGYSAGPPCFVAGTPVLTQDGMIPIESVIVGDLVLTHENRWRPVTATMSRLAETVRLGPIVSTADHPFYTAAQGEDGLLRMPDWTPADQTRGSFLATPASVPHISDVMLPPGFDWWLVGRYVADGWTGRDGVMMAIGDTKAAEFEAHATGWTVAPQQGCSRRTTPNHEAASWLLRHFGQGATRKTLPAWIFSLPERDEFLEGYLAGDGHWVTRSQRAGVTTSPCLAAGLRLLAVSLGFTVSTSTVLPSPHKVIDGRTVNQSPWWRVTMVKNDARYTHDVGPFHWSKQRRIVRPQGQEKVYDLTVAQDHSFTAWGFVVHNCQSFSSAGTGSGRPHLGSLADAAALVARGVLPDRAVALQTDAALDERSILVLEPMLVINRHRPRWIMLEQVPAVLPVWQEYAEILRDLWGYGVQTAVLKTEQYGVPQTRKRAILVARLDGEARLPEPTHSQYYPKDRGRLDPGVLPWISMADALSFDSAEPLRFCPTNERPNSTLRALNQPAPTLAFGRDRPRWIPQAAMPDDTTPLDWVHTRPSPTIVASFAPDVVAKPGYRKAGDPPRQRTPGSVRVTVEEAGVLQSFRPDYRWSGPSGARYQQVGNACPPLLSAAVLTALLREI